MAEGESGGERAGRDCPEGACHPKGSNDLDDLVAH